MTLSKPIVSAKYEEDGVVDENVKEDAEKVKLWGAELGYGVEYFFDENFSLGGEFGARYIHLNYNDESIEEFYNPDTGWEQSKVEHNYNFSFKPTYSRISLNFYF
ncbi:MAG: hypothetical protein GY816_16600 [Cytophagales bacterium]|nr:hypothetical protein [Cytophagales bacterium]